MKKIRIPALLVSLFLTSLLLAACDSTPAGGKPQSSAPGTTTSGKADESTTAPTEAPPTTPPESSDPTTPPTTLAKTLEGKPYRYGAAGPDDFDNSGFVYYCLKQNGITAPRKTGDLAKAGTAVGKDELQAGDVVFFYNDTPEIAQYTGIYLGGGRFIACSNEEKPVIVQDMTLKYFTDHYVTARRF